MAKKPGDRAEYLTPEELNRIENVVVGDLFFSTLYNILRYSGRRLGEIVGTSRGKKMFGGIRLKDVDFDKNEMKTIILKTKKRILRLECKECKKENPYKNKFCFACGNKLPKFDKSKLKYQSPEEKTIPMRPEISMILKTYINKHRPKFKPNDYLFRKYSLSYLKKKIKQHTKQASIDKNFSLHGYRHAFVTNCKKAGMSNEDIAKWTGHKRPSTLNIYDRMVPDDIRDKIEKVKL